MNLRIFTITLTRKESGEGITEVFGNQVEAVNYYLQVAQLNKIQWAKRVTKIDDDLCEHLYGENRKSILSLKAYEIKPKTKTK